VSSVVIALVAFGSFYMAYRVYGGFLAEKVFGVDPRGRPTPAHEMKDGVDHVPTDRRVLWGHHFTSIAGASPIVGPAIGVIWGWLPALLVITVWLVRARRPWSYTFLPMAFMLAMTLVALLMQIRDFLSKPTGPDWLLTCVAGAIVLLAGWLVVEAALAWKRIRCGQLRESLEGGASASEAFKSAPRGPAS
jgi:carbon starvation protein CstA